MVEGRRVDFVVGRSILCDSGGFCKFPPKDTLGSHWPIVNRQEQLKKKDKTQPDGLQQQ